MCCGKCYLPANLAASPSHANLDEKPQNKEQALSARHLILMGAELIIPGGTNNSRASSFPGRISIPKTPSLSWHSNPSFVMGGNSPGSSLAAEEAAQCVREVIVFGFSKEQMWDSPMEMMLHGISCMCVCTQRSNSSIFRGISLQKFLGF